MGMVLPRSIGHNDVIRLEDDERPEGFRDYSIVFHIERTQRCYGFWLYPCDIEPGKTYASCCWFPKDERIERVRKW